MSRTVLAYLLEVIEHLCITQREPHVLVGQVDHTISCPRCPLITPFYGHLGVSVQLYIFFHSMHAVENSFYCMKLIKTMDLVQLRTGEHLKRPSLVKR